MANEELIKNLELIKAEIEWEYPLDHQSTIDAAIAAVKRLGKIEDIIKKWDFDLYRTNVFLENIGEVVNENKL